MNMSKSVSHVALAALAVAALLAPGQALAWHPHYGPRVYFGPPLYVPPPVYLGPPPIYYAPRPYPPAAQTCYAGAYICPLDQPAYAGGTCSCPATNGRAYGSAH
jgi:hypothetical protein